MGKVKSALQILLSHPRFFHFMFGMGLILRLALLLVSGQLQTENYWEYGQIANQLLQGNCYSFPFVNEQLAFLNDTYPSALVPPGYVVFLIPFLWIQNIFVRNFLLFTTQIGISMAAIWIGHWWTSKRWNPSIANLTLPLFCFLPDLALAPLTVGPTVWFHFLVVILIYYHDQPSLIRRNFSFLFAGTMLVFMRSEALLWLAILSGLELWKRKKIGALAPLMGMLVLLGPWVIRNQQVLGKTVISNNFGINFYRGNNPEAIGNWPPVLSERALQFRQNPATYESSFDDYSLHLALEWIKENPGSFFNNIPVKIWRFWVFDWPDPRSRSLLNLATWLPVLGLILVGFFLAKPSIRQPECLLFLTYTLLIMVFFPQIRYLTMVKFFMLPYAGVVLNQWLLEKR